MIIIFTFFFCILIDVLFNNGAYGLPALVEDIPVDSLRDIFETNFFGWHSLTKEIIPHMKVNGSGRIIQNSSVLGFMALKYRGAYTATKYAIEAMSDTLRLEIKDDNSVYGLLILDIVGKSVRNCTSSS